jgi:N-acetyl-anhydromuramyl-L-alanine amidase AmpD
MVKIENIEGVKCFGKQKKKKQIILTHTSRNLKDYISSLKYRYNGKYDKVPNFIISRDGVVYRLLPEIGFSNYFQEENINRNSIIISLENLGWLQKMPLNDYYVNWIGDIYKEQVYERKWRDYFFWQPYTEKQINSCVELCKTLFNEYSIDKKCVGHNTKVEGIERFEGIVSKSNFDSKYTGLSPAFNFENFLKKLENEQLV